VGAMVLSLVIAAGIVISGFAVTWLGVELTFYPPQSAEVRKRVRITLGISFLVLLGFTLWATMRGERAMANLPKQIADYLKGTIGPATQESTQQGPAKPAKQADEAHVKPIETVRPKQEQLFVDCYSTRGSAVLPSEGHVYVLSLQEIPESVMKVDNLEDITGKPGLDFSGKDINGLPIKVAQCHITSYGSGPIFNITTTPHVTFQQAVQKSASESESGKVTLSREWPIKIPKIDSGPDHAYVFYVMNESNRFVSLSFPDKVTASVLGNSEQRTLQLIKGQKLALQFSPIK
jgi:hypothetical protein